MSYCGSCKFFRPIINGVAPGECRRFPPQIAKYFLPPQTIQLDVSYPPLTKEMPACAEFVAIEIVQ